MGRIGYHASHEQFAPSELLTCVRAAEDAGFAAIMCSDHLAPWSERQGQAGFAWSWLGAAMQASTLPFGVITVPGNWRYHPAITAQAGATLAEMFGERFDFLALGSGEALNETVVGAGWPGKQERNERLVAGADIIRALWRGETVNRDGPIPAVDARIYSLPGRLPPLIVGALTPETAEWAGGWADGLITIACPREQMKRMVDAFHRGGGAGKPMILQVHVSYAATDDEALANAYEQWRSNAVTARLAENLTTPAQFDDTAKTVRPEDMHEHVRISADMGKQLAWVEEDFAMGFDTVFLHNVGRNQREFIEAFGRR